MIFRIGFDLIKNVQRGLTNNAKERVLLMASCSLQKIVNNEAVEFIRIWQTSKSLNEVVDRLEESDVWLNREERLGDRWVNRYVRGRWKDVKRRETSTFTTRNLAKSFESFLRYSKGVDLKYQWWVCEKEYTFVDLKQLAESFTAIEQADNVTVFNPSC